MISTNGVHITSLRSAGTLSTFDHIDDLGAYKRWERVVARRLRIAPLLSDARTQEMPPIYSPMICCHLSLWSDVRTQYHGLAEIGIPQHEVYVVSFTMVVFR